MMKIGKSLTVLQEKILPILEQLAHPIKIAEPLTRIPVTTPKDVVHASGTSRSVTSTVEHDAADGRPGFKMDIVFENADEMDAKTRMDTSMELLSEMEDLLEEYKVSSLNGTYGIK